MTEAEFRRGEQLLLGIADLKSAIRGWEHPRIPLSAVASDKVRAIAIADLQRQIAEKEKEFAAL